MSIRSLLSCGWSSRARSAAGAMILSLAALPAQSAIVINEVDTDQAGTDAAEFVELYNTETTPVTLTDHVLVFFNGSNDQSYLTLSLSGLTVPANGYVVIGNTGVPNVSSVTFGDPPLQNGQDAVALYSGVPTAAGFPNNTPVANPPGGAVLVDAVVYDTADGDDTGLLDALTPGQPQIDEGAGGAGGPAETNSISRVPDGGTPLVTTTYIAKAPTPGVSNGTAPAAALTLEVSPATFVEDGSTGTVTGTVTRTGNTDAALTVTLTSANPAEATVPASVEIGIGQTQQTFTVTAVDELVVDGNKTFNISAAAAGFTTVTRSITVQDNDVAAFALTVSTDLANVAENAIVGGTVSRPADAPSLNLPLTVNLASSNTSRATVDASVVIPANLLNASFTITGVPDNVFGPTVNVTITATASGYANGTATVGVTNVDSPPPAAPPTVVFNKWLNISPDTVELLVVGNGTPGTTLNMSGMIIKDFSGSIVNDGGGKRVFSNPSLFDAVPVGTLIVISAATTSSDTDPSDFLLRLGLGDLAYFTGTSGTFDLSASEMVMIKSAGSPESGQDGAIHALAARLTAPATPDRFDLTTSSKLLATGTNSAIAGNSTSTLADFNGTDATSSATLTAAAFGKANNPTNNGFIRGLRGITSLSGVGGATITNETPASPFLGKNIFGRGLTGQKLALSLLSDVSPGTLTRASIEVPAALGVPLAVNVSVTGAGAGTPGISITGQTINLTGLAATTLNPAVVNIGGLNTPSPTGAAADGRYTFALSTAGPTGTLAPVAVSPSAVVIIPIQSLRDVDSITGVANDLNKIVAVSGVVTEENFNNTQLSGFLQDGDFGLNIFSFTPSNFTPLVRGNRYVITGSIVQFAGLTEISPSLASDMIDLGAATAPTPLVVTPLEISAPLDPQLVENLEGRLIKMQGLVYVNGTWGDPSGANINDVVLSDSGGNNITIRIAQATDANLPPATYPATITGILSQATPTPTNLFTGYVLMPRDAADVVPDPVSSGYATWATAYPTIGSSGDDADGDGHSNYLEYALGTVPDDRTSVKPLVLSTSGGHPALSIMKGTAAAADPGVFYEIEGSTDLTNWATPASPDTPLQQVINNDTTYTVRYMGTSATYYFRLNVGPPPP